MRQNAHMRIVLVLVVAIVLVAAAWMFLAGGDAITPVAPMPAAVEPRAAELAPPTLAELERAPESAKPAPIASDVPASTPSARARIAIVVVDERSPGRAPDGLSVECADALARPLALEGEGAARRGTDVVPGPYTITVASAHGRLATEQVTVLPVAEEQRFEVRLEPAPVVRVHWQADDGLPILEALETLDLGFDTTFVRVATDTRVRAFGEPAPKSPTSSMGTRAGRGSGLSPTRLQRNEPDSPPDHFCDLAIPGGFPVVLCASIDGAIVDSVAVDGSSAEVVFRTPIEALRRLRATVSFCLLDTETGERVRDGRFGAFTGSAHSRPMSDVGSEGCLVEARFTPGRWVLVFEAPGRATRRRTVDLQPGAVLDLGDVDFLPLGDVVVHARLPDGSAARGLHLEMFTEDSSDRDDPFTAATDAQGSAHFQGLNVEPYVLVVRDTRFARKPILVVPKSAPGTALVELRAEAGVEIALDFGPRLATSSRAYLNDRSSTPVAILALPMSGLVPLRLVPGDYYVALEGEDEARAFTVTNESVVFDLR